MKARGWMCVAALSAMLAFAPGRAMAAASSDVGDIVHNIDDVLDKPLTDAQRQQMKYDASVQAQVAESIADKMNLSGGQRGELVARAVRSGQTGMLGALNYLASLDSSSPLMAVDAPLSVAADAPVAGTLSAPMTRNSGVKFENMAIEAALAVWSGKVENVNLENWTAVNNSLEGRSATAGADSGLETIEFNSRLVHQHARDVRSDMRDLMYNVTDGCAPAFVNRVWASPFHNYVKQKDRDLDSGYEYKMTGVSVGYDFISGPFSAGASFTYSRGDYDWNDADNDNKINNYGASLYAQYYTSSGFFASIDGGYNYGDNEWNRNLRALNGTFDFGNDAGAYRLNAWERGDNHTSSYWVGGLLGYDFKTCSGFTLTPTVGLYWNHAQSSAYQTRVDGDSSGRHLAGYDKFKRKSLLLPVEISASYDRQISDCSKISLNINTGYTYNFKNDGAKGQVESWGDVDVSRYMSEIEGIRSGQNRWHAGVGAQYNYKNLDFGLNYRYEGAKKYQSHNVSANVGVRF